MRRSVRPFNDKEPQQHSNYSKMSSPSARQETKMSHIVRFSDSEEVVEIEPWTEEELKACFYQARDFDRFRLECDVVAHLYAMRRKRRLPWHDDVHSLRGIEMFLLRDSNDRQLDVIRHCRVVIDRQKRLDSVKLAGFSSKMSRLYKCQAKIQARVDAASAYRRPESLWDSFHGKMLIWKERQRLNRRLSSQEIW